MVKLKEKLIKRIQETSDANLLQEVNRLLELDLGEQEVYKLSSEQKTIVAESRQQIIDGESLTDEHSNEAADKWLKEK